jgi:hypothetical protein
MRRELRIALGVIGALVVIGVVVSLALQPELMRPPGGGGPDWRNTGFLVGMVAVGVASVIQGAVALADEIGKRREKHTTPPQAEPPVQGGGVAHGGTKISVENAAQQPGIKPSLPVQGSEQMEDFVVNQYVELQFSQRQGEAWVRINEGPLGQNEGLFRKPFTPAEAEARIEKAGSAGDPRAELAALGKELFAALNQAGVGEVLRVAMNQARTAQSTVLLQLRFDEGAVELAALPWELLHDDRRHLLAAGAVDLTRYITYNESVVPLTVQAPLRVLYVGAAPKSLPKLEIGASRRAIQETQGLAVEELTSPTYDALLRRMAAKPGPHVFHFDGHGSVENGQACLCFEIEDGGTDAVDADALQNALYNRIALVVLNACRSAALDSAMISVFQGIAPALIQAGIPAVVGMQFPIMDKSAVRFIDAFYDAIARGATLTTAMAEARRWLYREGSWFIPTLYLRTSDPRGVLLPPKKEPVQAEKADVMAEEIKALRAELEIHQSNLRQLRLQGAIFGAGATPLHLINQIRHEEQAIEEIEGKLAQTEE